MNNVTAAELFRGGGVGGVIVVLPIDLSNVPILLPLKMSDVTASLPMVAKWQLPCQ